MTINKRQTNETLRSDMWRACDIVHRDNNVGVKQLVLERLNVFVNSTTLQPNRLFATPEFDEFPLACALSETPNHGFLGQVDFLREVGNIATHGKNAASRTPM